MPPRFSDLSEKRGGCSVLVTATALLCREGNGLLDGGFGTSLGAGCERNMIYFVISAKIRSGNEQLQMVFFSGSENHRVGCDGKRSAVDGDVMSNAVGIKTHLVVAEAGHPPN